MKLLGWDKSSGFPVVDQALQRALWEMAVPLVVPLVPSLPARTFELAFSAAHLRDYVVAALAALVREDQYGSSLTSHQYLRAIPVLEAWQAMPENLELRMANGFVPQDEDQDTLASVSDMTFQLRDVLATASYSQLADFLTSIRCGYKDETIFLRASRLVFSFCDKMSSIWPRKRKTLGSRLREFNGAVVSTRELKLFDGPPIQTKAIDDLLHLSEKKLDELRRHLEGMRKSLLQVCEIQSVCLQALLTLLCFVARADD